MTSEVFENAIRYRDSYDPGKGEPLTWLIGIARRSIAQFLAGRANAPTELFDIESPSDVEAETLQRIALDAALAALNERDRDLLALRYAIDLRPREIAVIVDMSPNAATVALHRALVRLRAIFETQDDSAAKGLAVDLGPGTAGEADDPV